MLGCLENYLYKRIRNASNSNNGKWARDIIQEMLDKNMIDNPKQAWATLDKWLDKGYYDYGTVIDKGWITDKKRPARQ